ncbi:MAG: biotin--[acetyl-CoA-carboxylase] ligase [Tannerellaceae bacterium]|jgi:BirA family biotin operon repressor/biotin-[acetyl-CoA-carboxylase] ligase|nr:biotin--[acetyl-CoA-carboxylase] ligase [Tannerellaceae bacterium]
MDNTGKEPRLIHLAETESTNKFLQMLTETEEIPSGSMVLADFQTAGRGQIGNSWESEAGKNLTFSVLFRPIEVPANMPFVISEMVSLSVKHTLDKYIPDVSVKWPNDIYCKNEKIAGILIENTIMQGQISQSVIGIGININQTEFCNDIPNAVSLIRITGESYDRMAVMENFRQIYTEQSVRVDNLCFDSIHRDYLHAIYRKDGYHKYEDEKGIFEAGIEDIEPTGHLILERIDGSRSRYAFKEVTYII